MPLWMFQCCAGIDCDALMIAAVMGSEGILRELLGACVQLVGCRCRDHRARVSRDTGRSTLSAIASFSVFFGLVTASRGSTRTWGYWTEQKLSVLAAYLPAFTTASQRSPRTLYLDLFAGDDRNLSRTTGEEISGSPRVALDTAPPHGRRLVGVE